MNVFCSDALLNRNAREYILICYYLGLELLRGMGVKINKPCVTRNCVKYEGLELKNDQKRLNIKTTRNLGMKVKSILNQLNGTLYFIKRRGLKTLRILPHHTLYFKKIQLIGTHPIVLHILRRLVNRRTQEFVTIKKSCRLYILYQI